MAYDPQANRRRPKPTEQDPAPVEALLGDTPQSATDPASTGPLPDDPPPSPSVTPDPADPPSDKLLINTTLASVLGAIAALLILRHLWRRGRGGAPRSDDPGGGQLA